MKNLKKKGFTIVELVIVIAVVAILAAVLIPTFVNLTKKANMSSDQVAVRNMNTLLAAEFVDEKPTELKQVIDMLEANGYNVDALTPLSTGYIFVWNAETNKIEIVETGNVTNTLLDLNDGKKFMKKEISEGTAFISAVEDGSDAVLMGDVELSDTMTIGENEKVTIDLNGYDLDASKKTSSRPFSLSSGTSLTINAEESVINCGDFGLFEILNGANNIEVEINGGTFISEVAPSNGYGALIRLRGNENVKITLNNVTYIDQSKTNYIVSADTENDCELNINDCSFESALGFIGVFDINIAKSVIKTDTSAFEVSGSNATITECTIEVGNQGSCCYAVAVSSGGKAIIKNCNITANTAFGVLPTTGIIEATNITGDSNGEVYNITNQNYLDKSYIKVDNNIIAEANR